MAERSVQKLSNYKAFIRDIEKAIGRKLDITTGGSKTSEHSTEVGALDIGRRSNKLTQAEYDLIGKLALDRGYRVGDEVDHLHIDMAADTRSKSRAKKRALSPIFYNIGSKQKGTYKPARAKRAKKKVFEKYYDKATKLKSSMYTLPKEMQKAVAKKQVEKNAQGYTISNQELENIRKQYKDKPYSQFLDAINKFRTME